MNQNQRDDLAIYLGLQEFAMPGFRMSRRLFERVAALCTRLPIAAVAQMAKLSWATVAKIDGRAIELALGDRALGATGRRKLRGVVSDLGYQSIIASRLRHAVHVLDRFHIVQWMNEALNQLRRRLFSGAPRDELGRTLKVKQGLLLSARENLEHRHQLLLNELMEQNQPLYQAYLLKEQLRGILQYPWRYFGVLRQRLQEWILAAFDTGLHELIQVAHRLARHLDAVIAGHEHDVPLGLCEAVNSKIAALRCQARGYRDPEYFKLKIFQRCSLPDNPWARIVL